MPRWPIPVLNAVADPRERRLAGKHRAICSRGLAQLPGGEAGLVREVVGIIIGGQRLDLERFGGADGENPVALA